MMQSRPIMFLGDAAEGIGGLSRITRDVATLTSRLPDFRVSTLGRGAHGSRQLPFVQYSFPEFGAGWGQRDLLTAWADFAGAEPGIIMSIWDASRLHWFAQPKYLADTDPALSAALSAGQWRKWGYFPIDSTGPADRLSAQTCDTLLGYDRILCYTRWARDLVVRSIGVEAARERDLDWLPHGINLGTFTPQPRVLVTDSPIVGCVATNQTRKDWGLVAMTCALLKERYPEALFPWHSDVALRHWNLPALIADYGLSDNVDLSTDQWNDTQLARFYSSCDLTLHPGTEGFGYPIVESLACGTPVLHMTVGGGAELVPEPWRVAPVEMRLDTPHNVFRPVFNPRDWATKAVEILESKPTVEECRALTEHLSWQHLWPTWRRWLLRGLA